MNILEQNLIDETRYAILIGINDYDVNPLNFCVNDAMKVKDELINKCMFKEENIFIITSSKKDSKKDITGKYTHSLLQIKKKFIKGKDSILFYFAGHGMYDNGESLLAFQDTFYPIEKVFTDISDLQPKIQIYIIDACQSGSKVLTRDNKNNTNNLKRYIESSSGIMFLYACTEKESANELSSLKHGLLTYNFLTSLNEEKNYDSEGFLTFNRIVDDVQRATINISDFQQTPVIENKITGYYPFAANEKALSKTLLAEGETFLIDTIRSESIELNFNAIRIEIMNHLKKSTEISFNNFEIIDNYDDCKTFDNLNNFPYDKSKLIDEIVSFVEKNKLTPLPNLIYKVDPLNGNIKNYSKYLNPLGSISNKLSFINNPNLFSPQKKINFSSEDLFSKFKLLISKNIFDLSWGFGYIIYQAKWGVILLKINFLIDWNGLKVNEVKDISIEYLAIPLKENITTQIEELEIDFTKFNENKIKEWNRNRNSELIIYNDFIE